MKKTVEAKYYNFPWDTINHKEDVVGFDYKGCCIYVLKRFKKDTNNYLRIVIKLPKEIGHTIWLEAISHMD